MLKPKKKLKITKKDLKEDQFVLTVFKVQEVFTKYMKQIGIGIVVILVIILGAIYISNDISMRNQLASQLLTDGSMKLQDGNIVEGIQKLEDVVKEYKDTKSAIIASYKLGKKYWLEGDYIKAREYYQNVVDEGGNIDFILAGAYSGLGDCYFADKNYEEAAKKYLEAANIVGNDEDKAAYYLSAAMAYQNGSDFDKSKNILEKIVIDFNKTPAKQKAEKILTALM